MTFNASGLSEGKASDISFTVEGSETVDIVRYYHQKYNRRLRYPGLPCVIQRRGAQNSYFPPEVLIIV